MRAGSGGGCSGGNCGQELAAEESTVGKWEELGLAEVGVEREGV